MARPLPLLFLSDSPELPTGLGRIGRDLATLCSRLPEFRVGYMGRGGIGTNQLPFTTYNFPATEQWGERVLPQVWSDFAPTERGVVFSLWDPSRCFWLGAAGLLPECSTREFMLSGRVRLWGYFPIDSTGPNDRLTGINCTTLTGYERILTPTKWGAGVVGRSISGHSDVDWIPHGLNLTTFTPRDRQEAREIAFGSQVMEGDRLIGIVATNQARKDWGLMAEVCARLTTHIRDVRFWWHTDLDQRHWSIPALIEDFGLRGHVILTTNEMSDQTMATAYSACDLTLHPGLGEGFGFPIAESLACGVPAIHGGYAGGAELIQNPDWLIRPEGMRLDTLYNCYRPVFRVEDWVSQVVDTLADPPDPLDCSSMVQHLGWPKLWQVWKRWLLKGV